MDIWETIKKWFEDVITPADLEWYVDEPEAKPQKTLEKSKKSSESQ